MKTKNLDQTYDNALSKVSEGKEQKLKSKNKKNDSLRKLRKMKTFFGYLGVVLLFVLVGILSALGFEEWNIIVLIAVAWGFIWWRVSPRLYPRFVGQTVTCPECQNTISLIDNWKCPRCGNISQRHILAPCEKCKTMGGKLDCPSCGTVIYV